MMYNLSITEEEITKFYSDLCYALNKIAEGEKVSFPKHTDIYGLPDFVADEISDEWVRALHNLGFRAGTIYMTLFTQMVETFVMIMEINNTALM